MIVAECLISVRRLQGTHNFLLSRALNNAARCDFTKSSRLMPLHYEGFCSRFASRHFGLNSGVVDLV